MNLDFNKVVGGAFALIFVYLLFNSKDVSTVTNSLGQTGVNLIKSLQGR